MLHLSPVLVLPEDDGHAVLTVNAAAQERSARLLGGTGRVVHEDAGAIGAPLAGPAQGWPLDGLHGSERDARNGLVHRGTRHYREVDGLWLQPEPLLVLGVPDGSLGTPRLLMGAYAAGNVNVWADPSGYAVETPWDAANVALGVASFGMNVAGGSYGAAALDAAGVGYDVLATAVPGLPGGAATVLNVARAADKGADVLRAASNAVEAGGAAAKSLDAARDASAAAKGLDGLPKPPTGRGSVPPGERDPKRYWSKPEKQGALDARGGKCEGCDQNLSIDSAQGHHKVRHSDGGKTNDDNLAVLCPDCHKEVHKP